MTNPQNKKTDKNNFTVEFFFNTLLSLCTNCINSKNASIRESYITLRRLFFIVLDNQTDNAGVSFSGPFAKMDYLIKLHHVPQRVYHALNDFRNRLKDLNQTLLDKSEETQLNLLLLDIRLLAEFSCYIFQCSIPKELDKILPLDFPSASKKSERAVADCIRMVVSDWDDRYIYGDISDDKGETITVDYLKGNGINDFSSLKSLLVKNAQLNLLRPKVENNILFPEVIVYEPDFLVDVSTIADCFEEYGQTPLSYLIKRISPRKSSQAMLIGNFAGQLLDEEIYGRDTIKDIFNEESFDEDAAYRKSIKRFFRDFAMSIATCPDFDSEAFHKEARHQLRNIHHYVNEFMRGNRLFDIKNGLLEPTFFSDILGIQGRIDLLSENKRVLVEQKSGKWGFPNGGYQKKHYLQMLLYLAWLRYDQQIANINVNPLLLYSKYPTEGNSFEDQSGIIKTSPAPELLLQAISLRNEIVFLEKKLEQGGVNLFDDLQADSLNTNIVNNRLWTRYQRPQIEEVLQTIQNASDTERAYFYRFFSFLDKEYHLAKNDFALSWNFSMEEKIEEGLVLPNLTIDETIESKEINAIETILFKRDENDSLPLYPDVNLCEDDTYPTTANFRKGDIVVCYAYPRQAVSPLNSPLQAPVHHRLNVCRTIVFRANITALSAKSITIKLRAPQRNEKIFAQQNLYWALEHDFLDSASTSTFKDLFSFLSMKNPQRKSLILNQRPPLLDKSVVLNGDYGTFNELVLKAKQALDFFIVIGPPGTGKTSFAMVNILKETLSTPTASVLLVSYTNRAVEEICDKLIHEKIDFIRIGHEHSCSEEFDLSYLLKNRIEKHLNREDMIAYLSSVRVYVGTTAALSATQSLFSLKRFDLAIVDEASQILEPNLLGLLTAKDGNAIKKFVFIGDQKQLPAVVQQSTEESVVTTPELQRIGLTDCRHSFFERILRNIGNNPDFVFQLSKQGRMHPIVCDFVSSHYYENHLDAVPLPHQKNESFYDKVVASFSDTSDVDDGNQTEIQKRKKESLKEKLRTSRLFWVDTPTPIDHTSDMVNKNEADVIADIVYQTWKFHFDYGKHFDTCRSIGVIVPYRSQIGMIRNEIEKKGVEEIKGITIDTVERYQGSQRDVIIYGTTIKHPYQLDFLASNTFVDPNTNEVVDRKLNVAITRAKEQMVVVGNATLLMLCESYAPFIHYLKNRDALLSFTD